MHIDTSEQIKPAILNIQGMLQKIDRLHLPPASRRDVESILVRQVSTELDRALPWQAGHGTRTAAVATMIGQQLGLDAGELHDLKLAALLHDIGDTISPENHSELGASVLQPYVSAKTHWIIKHHGVFQGYYYFHHLGGDRDARERFRGHPMFDSCADFCHRWDQNSFDPDYDTMPLSAFEPALRRVFSRKPFGDHVGTV